jgi:putative polyhydroxyalkanoate system protein
MKKGLPMPNIHIHREHALGLAKARKIALQWAEEAEEKFDMECTIVEGERSDTVEFTRSGVSGTLMVEAHQFTLDAKLGFLLGAFSTKIESEIAKNLDAMLASGKAAADKAAAKTSKAKTSNAKTLKK